MQCSETWWRWMASPCFFFNKKFCEKQSRLHNGFEYRKSAPSVYFFSRFCRLSCELTKWTRIKSMVIYSCGGTEGDICQFHVQRCGERGRVGIKCHIHAGISSHDLGEAPISFDRKSCFLQIAKLFCICTDRRFSIPDSHIFLHFDTKKYEQITIQNSESLCTTIIKYSFHSL